MFIKWLRIVLPEREWGQERRHGRGGAKRRGEVQGVCVCVRERGCGATVREEKGKNRKTFYVYQCRKYVYSSSAKM